MRTSPRPSARKSATDGKALKIGGGAPLATAAKLRKKWQFAPDAIGMMEGSKDLSRRKGLSA